MASSGIGKTEPISLFASFNRKDLFDGTVRVVHEKLTNIGQKVKAPFARLDLSNLEKNQVYQLAFEQTSYELHLSKLLQELKHPDRLIDDFEIHHINRRFFGGEKTIKMLEGVLGFESTLSSINRQGGYGYQNNRSTHYEGVASNLGRRDQRDF